MRHIGILGGTFDPIHKGHLWIASQAKEEYGLTEIWLMPAGNPYFKEGDPVTPAPLRFQMTALAAGEKPGFFASDYEIRKEGRTYTAETLQGLCREYPEEYWRLFLVFTDRSWNYFPIHLKILKRMYRS